MDKAAYKAQRAREWEEFKAAERLASARILVVAERLCVRCVHFEIESFYGYGDDSVELDCFKGHIGDGQRIHDTDDLRKMIIRANTCPDYSEPK